ncbi:GNAT family N-acetyltransferase [Sphingomonas sp.]|uniref:GNAT family N-acetyltransferase n=1 Tax=Sphingomonas sp. TaxID=28214 RepID=UPI000DB37730|nr:GNAT family N-acetyltransferase [Sphingomonas sp.]PZU09248.1 MAG: GNAT family N-acetyltransferase [Sphingomonas sp.]
MRFLCRDATEADLPAIVGLLADDPLGATRENASLPLAPSYLSAFRAIQATPRQRLIVAEEEGLIVGTIQIVLIPAISRRGSLRGLIEAVRIAARHRGNGRGEQLVRWAVAECRAAGCASVQLTSHDSRADAHRFWKRMGFVPTHVGFKLDL